MKSDTSRRVSSARWTQSAPRSRWSVTLAILIVALSAGGCCKLVPWGLAVDPSLGSSENGNGILEPGEEVVVEPTWKTEEIVSKIKTPDFGSPPPTCTLSAEVKGEASDSRGPEGAFYSMPDAAASYGSFNHVSFGSTRSCSAAANCYSLFVSNPATRPAPHWDMTFTETLNGVSANNAPKIWTLHVGSSFGDARRSNPFYAKIETVYHKGIMDPCEPGAFCPENVVSRASTATFLARAIAGGDDKVPETGSVGANAYSCTAGGTSLFVDVDPTDAFCKHVHFIASKSVTLGCAPSEFCPADQLSRLQMAALIAKSMVQPYGGYGVSLAYSAPGTGRSYSCDSASPSVHFTDVPDTDPFCKHVHYLWARGVLDGCGPDQFCASGDVTREEMAKFLVNAFGLKLYGP